MIRKKDSSIRVRLAITILSFHLSTQQGRSIMSMAQRIFATAFCGFTALCLSGFSGCVGPMACGPAANGPFAFGHPCEGCGDCEGCGELYLDPWINHPADVCDPCDCCGNHNGQSCGKCRSVFDGIPSLWGYRCDGGGCSSCGTRDCDGSCGPLIDMCGDSCGGCDTCCTDTCGGCDSCNDTCTDTCGGCDSCGEHIVVHESDPTVAKEIVRATEPYKPHRTRKIFNPKKIVQPRTATRPTHTSQHPGDSGRVFTITR